MLLDRLYIEAFRNIKTVSLTGFGNTNLFYGENGSGKTSILEAIYTLSAARSFRTHKWRSLISHGETAFTVSGSVINAAGVETKLGVRRALQEASAFVRVDGQTVKTASSLAQLLPIQVIDSATFSLLEGAPEKRRQLMDWLVFHVEPQRFLPIWQRYGKALQHRNALLRQQNASVSEELVYWTREVATAGDEINTMRESLFSAFVPVVMEVYGTINEQSSQPVEINLSYHPGWDRETSLRERLESSLDRDLELGYTRDGPHRADIRARAAGKPALEVLSRGQLKSLIASFRVGQAKLLRQYGINSVVLVDDLPAELDDSRRRALCRILSQLGLQVFYTSIEQDDLASCFEEQPKRFHVKHGQVIPHA